MRTIAVMRERGEAGFTLTELLVAVTMMAVLVLLTLHPVITATRLLSTSRNTVTAESVAAAKLEEIRALPYASVGTTTGHPFGVLAGDNVTVIEDVAYAVQTEVTFQGSASGLAVVPQGGDGVEGFWDPGIDYKLVRVTVTRADGSGESISMETLVAPRNLSAHEGLANLLLGLAPFEPFGPADQNLYPLPKAHLVSGTRIIFPAPDAAGDHQIFVGIQANDPDPASVDHEYAVRFGPTLSDLGSGGWRLHPQDLADGTDVVHLGSTETTNRTLRVYRPAELTVRAIDKATGTPVVDATLIVTQGTSTLTLTGPDQTAPGEWVVTDFDGSPMMPGSYDLTVMAPGYASEVVAGEAIPEAYPDPNHLEEFLLEPAPTVAFTFHVDDWQGAATNAIRGAQVTIDLPIPLVLTTDLNGDATVVLPVLPAIDVTVDSLHGHESVALTIDTTTTSSADIDLARPVTHGGIKFIGWITDGWFGYRELGSLEDWKRLDPNYAGEGSAAVLPGKWEVAAFCPDGTLHHETTKNVSNPNSQPTYNPLGSCA